MQEVWNQIDELHFGEEAACVRNLIALTGLDQQSRVQITQDALQLVNDVRASFTPTIMESFLAEYGLSTDEGIALMCLAEAMLRVPDAETIDELIALLLNNGHFFTV